MKALKKTLTTVFALMALIAFSPDLSAQEDERTPADAFEWLQEKMEQFKFNNYVTISRKN